MSIHKRRGKKGHSYQVRYRREGGTQASRTFKTKREAERFEATLVVDDEGLRGLTAEQRKATFAEYASRWQRTKQTRHSAKTKIRRDQILRMHLLPELGSMRIRAIRHSHIRDLVTKWEELGLSRQTIRNHIGIARPIFKLAIKDDIISKDPTSGLELGQPKTDVGTVLDQKQCQTLLAGVDDHYRRLFYTLLSTGLRIGELFELEVRDVDFTNRWLNIRKSKTDTGIRQVDLSENDLQVLKQQIDSLGTDASDGGVILFRSPRGKSIHYRNLAMRVLKKVITEHNLPHFTFHDLRKTHATMLVAAGIDPKVVQQRLGHASIETTLKYYAQPTKERRESAARVAIAYLSTDLSTNVIEARL
jgi:integrase